MSHHTPTITLHWLEKSRAQRILMLLEEIGVPYQTKTYKRDPTTRAAPPQLKKIHPLGKSPVITVGDRTIAESALIVEYLSEHFAPHLIPSKWKTGCEGKIGGETEEYMRYRYFMHYCEGSLMPLFLLAVLSKDSKEYLDTSFATRFAFLEEQLSSAPNGGPYLCGQTLTGADIMLGFPVLLVAGGWGNLDVDKARFPKLFWYAEALKKIESYRKAEAKVVALEGELSA
ncbi:hypothetical protein B0H16DRAFT_111563 [Mycena metata]|uniref:glutathione transferase n=1 Tax=Mycena metata TaxID=1033252 RepID=A0AAD7I855_9AGAR|nr:hypothetical protein B0H16DRAFT_111563 [Mycena metata]